VDDEEKETGTQSNVKGKLEGESESEMGIRHVKLVSPTLFPFMRASKFSKGRD